MWMRLKGFTLIELLVTLVILALLATAAAPVMQVTAQRAKEQELRRALWIIRDGIDAYKQASDEGMIAKSASASGYPKSLEALLQGADNVKDAKKPKIYFLRNIPRDPFNTMPESPPQDTWGKRSYSSPADEPKEGDDIFDVYSLSAKTGLNGVLYREW